MHRHSADIMGSRKLRSRRRGRSERPVAEPVSGHAGITVRAGLSTSPRKRGQRS